MRNTLSRISGIFPVFPPSLLSSYLLGLGDTWLVLAEEICLKKFQIEEINLFKNITWCLQRKVVAVHSCQSRNRISAQHAIPGIENDKDDCDKKYDE